MVTKRETPILVKIVGVERIYRYAFKLNSRGIMINVRVAISEEEAKELPRMFRKGKRHVKVKSSRKPIINP